jgi:hypothetical protein
MGLYWREMGQEVAAAHNARLKRLHDDLPVINRVMIRDHKLGDPTGEDMDLLERRLKNPPST